MIIYSKNIYLEDEKISGFIKIEDKKISDIVKIEEEFAKDSLKDYILKVLKWDSNEEILDYSDFTIIPGFIDNHIHGWGTGSFWFEKSKKSITEMQKNLPKEGVTSFLATTGADTIEEILMQIDEANEVYKSNQIGAEVIGVHL